ncbi:MAG: copper-binding protein [Burkholderiaceae bacterium]|nr:copper-binding protein [Burkholderiaceae bacterium]
MKPNLLLVTLLAALAASTPLYAEPVAPPANLNATMSEGVVRKIDISNARISLKHGPITHLDMPAMSMVFRVQPPELPKGLKAGDAVKFHVEQLDGTYVVTAIQPIP